MIVQFVTFDLDGGTRFSKVAKPHQGIRLEFEGYKSKGSDRTTLKLAMGEYWRRNKHRCDLLKGRGPVHPERTTTTELRRSVIEVVHKNEGNYR